MDENLTFEQADDRITKLIGEMESGKLSFDESVACYTEACELLAFCTKKLEDGKMKIIDINEKLESLGKV